MGPSARIPIRPRTSPRLAAGIVAASAVACVLAGCSPAPSGGGAAAPAGAGAAAPTDPAAAFSPADGYVARGETVSPFADVPAVRNLDPALRAAVRQAATAARDDGIDLRISSGWRSERLQSAMLDQATARYGSAEEARRFVRSAERSSHVTGHAVDVLPTNADDWLARHGSTFGLCRSYANEMWHFELATEPGGTCPAPAADAEDGS